MRADADNILQIAWPTKNSQRLDIEMNPEEDRNLQVRAVARADTRTQIVNTRTGCSMGGSQRACCRPMSAVRYVRNAHGRRDSGLVSRVCVQRQYRWNSNPFELDGGDGMSEFDAGAFLAPYWMSVYWGLIAE